MKKIFVMMLAALGMVSCSQEEFIENENTNGAKAIVAQMPINSRISIDGMNLTWSKGNKFTPLDADYASAKTTNDHNYYQLVNEDADKSNGRFTPCKEMENIKFEPRYAIYPYYLYNSKESVNGKIILKYLNDPTYSHWGKTPQITYMDAPMFGEIIDNQVQFKFTTAMLKIDISGLGAEQLAKVTDIKIATPNYKLSGKCELDEKMQVKQIAGEEGKKYTLTVSSAYAIGNVYYVPVPKGDYPQMSITATIDGTSVSCGTRKNISFACGNMYTWTVQAKK